jgi:hypothetical protein
MALKKMGILMKYKGCNKKVLEALGLDDSYPPCGCKECINIKDRTIGDFNGNVWG